MADAPVFIVSRNMQSVQPQSPIIYRSWIFYLTVASLAASLGCPSKKVAPPVKPFAGKSVQVIVPDGPARLVLERHGSIWARNTDAKLKIVTPVPGQSAMGDVIIFNPEQMGDLVARNQLERVPESITSGGSWAGLSRIYRNKLLLWGETPYALPIIGDATFVIYRADLFKQAGKSPPKLMTELADLARYFFELRNKPSLPPINDDDALDRNFNTLAAAFAVPATNEDDFKNKKFSSVDLISRYGFYFDTSTGDPKISEPGFAQALQTLQSMQTYRSAKASVVESFRADDAVIGFGTLSDLANMHMGADASRYGVAPIPAGPAGDRVPFIGPSGYVGGVVRDTANAAAGWDLLNYLSSADISLEFVHDPKIGSAPFRPAHLSERRDGWFNYGLNGSETERLREALMVALEPHVINAPSRLRIPKAEEYRMTLLSGIRSALTNKSDPKSALEQVAGQWRELDAKVPKDQRINEYLRSLNLRP